MTNKLTPIDSLSGPERIVALSILQLLMPGTSVAIAEVLRTFAGKLEVGEPLSPGESKYLAKALRLVAEFPDRYGEPFGYQRRGGRPGISPLHKLAIGRRVDELNRPAFYGLDTVALPLADNTKGAGAYSVAAEEAGCSERMAERAHGDYLQFIAR